MELSVIASVTVAFLRLLTTLHNELSHMSSNQLAFSFNPQNLPNFFFFVVWGPISACNAKNHFLRDLLPSQEYFEYANNSGFHHLL